MGNSQSNQLRKIEDVNEEQQRLIKKLAVQQDWLRQEQKRQWELRNRDDTVTQNTFADALTKAGVPQKTMWCADGGLCKLPSDAKTITGKADLNLDGKATVKQLQLGDKFSLSGVGDAHGNDDWLRLFNKEGKDYHGGIAAGKGWFRDAVHLNGEVNIKGGTSELNPGKWATHFAFPADGKNHIRGDTDLRGHLDTLGHANFAKDVNVQGRLFLGDPSRSDKPNEPNSSDPYFLEKVSKGKDQSSLRLTINDNTDEALEIWGNACAVGDCHGPGAMQHRFQADGSVEHRRGINVTGDNPGVLIQKRYGGDSANRYGVGQFDNGATRVYAASAHLPATVNLSLAKADRQFDDILTIGTDRKTRVAGDLNVNGHLVARPNNAPLSSMPNGWGGGMHTWDLYANASIAAGRNGGVASFMNADGRVAGNEFCIEDVCLKKNDFAKVARLT
jgi:hypothetical protein